MPENLISLPQFKCSFTWGIVISSFVIRSILCLTKAIECAQGGLDTDKGSLSNNFGFWKALGLSFISSARSKNLDDYFLPLFVGIFELIILPILMYSNRYDVIGAWITIKTLGQWKKWGKSRTTYNRFILGNLLVILASFILYKNF